MRRLILIVILTILLFSNTAQSAKADSPYGSISNPVPIGDTLNVTESGTFKYSIKISNVMRGAKAAQELGT